MPTCLRNVVPSLVYGHEAIETVEEERATDYEAGTLLAPSVYTYASCKAHVSLY